MWFSQLFVLRNPQKDITLMVAKFNDDFLCSGLVDIIDSFANKLSDRFVVGKVILDSEFQSNGC